MMQMSKKIYISLMCFGLHLVTNHDLFVLNHYKTIFLQIDVFSWQQSGAPKREPSAEPTGRAFSNPNVTQGVESLLAFLSQ